MKFSKTTEFIGLVTDLLYGGPSIEALAPVTYSWGRFDFSMKDLAPNESYTEESESCDNPTIGRFKITIEYEALVQREEK